MIQHCIRCRRKKRHSREYIKGRAHHTCKKQGDLTSPSSSTTIHDSSLSWFQLFGTNVFVDISLKCKQDEEIHVYKVF
jgi:hypothetical protein